MKKQHKERGQTADNITKLSYVDKIVEVLSRQKNISLVSTDRVSDSYANLSEGTGLLKERYITVAPVVPIAHAAFTLEERHLAVEELNDVFISITGIKGLPYELEGEYRVSNMALVEGTERIILPTYYYFHRLNTDEINAYFTEKLGIPTPHGFLRRSGVRELLEKMRIVVFPSIELAQIDALESVPTRSLGAIKKMGS